MMLESFVGLAFGTTVGAVVGNLIADRLRRTSLWCRLAGCLPHAHPGLGWHCSRCGRDMPHLNDPDSVKWPK
jgi:hypothetical protein